MLQKELYKEILSLTTPASGMKAHAQIGAWHNSLDRMAAVILVSPLLNYLITYLVMIFEEWHSMQRLLPNTNEIASNPRINNSLFGNLG